MNPPSLHGDPDVEFYTEAKQLLTAFKRNHLVLDGARAVLLYLKNDKLYHLRKCGCDILYCGNSHELLNVGDVEVISGRRIQVVSQISTYYTMEHGLMIEVLHRCCPDMIIMYETPDAVRLATRLQSRVRGRVVMEPNTKETLVFFAPPD